ncbi:transmembrane signal receptor [Lithospermum erythrorhizon]|uniref:Transmembrane signal receptor n=1 Tax=Lithospermum erythrorhizon TaxID=34254 RepID=A0AAV3QJY3_LITER
MALFIKAQFPVSKLDPKATKTVFIGYSATNKGYRYFFPVTKKTFTSCDVTFFEHQPYFLPTDKLQEENKDHKDHREAQLWLWDPDVPVISHFTNDVQTTSKEATSKNISKEVDQSHVLENFDTESHNEKNELKVYFRRKKDEVTDPTQVQEFDPVIEPSEPTEQGDHVPNSESLDLPIAFRKALEKNNTWILVNLPPGKKPVGCKWVFTVKYNENGKIERYKARLVAKGFAQTYGIDFSETFAQVAKLNTIRVLLSIVANLDWELHQLYIKNAFLNGELEE